MRLRIYKLGDWWILDRANGTIPKRRGNAASALGELLAIGTFHGCIHSLPRQYS